MHSQRSSKRTEKLQAVATAEEVAAFKEACESLGLGPSDTLRRLAANFVEQVAEKKTVRVPLKMRLE